MMEALRGKKVGDDLDRVGSTKIDHSFEEFRFFKEGFQFIDSSQDKKDDVSREKWKDQSLQNQLFFYY